MRPSKGIRIFILKFLGLFFLLFYGTEAVIGLSTPENAYSPFVAEYLDYITVFRHFLLAAVQAVAGWGKVQTTIPDAYSIEMVGGKGVYIGYDCIGYGLFSFWIAFMFANTGGWKKKALWMLGGCFALTAINIFRITGLLVAINREWAIPLGWDHHTWFNIVAYAVIFLMIFLYDRAGWQKKEKEKEKPAKKEAVLHA